MNSFCSFLHQKLLLSINTQAALLPLLLLLSLPANAAALSTELIELDHKPLAPRFTLPDMQDKSRELSDYLGKPVIISFWATWCPPCRKEIPVFNRARAKLSEDDFVMLFVNINEGKETIEAYKKKVPIDLTILRDETAGQLTNWNLTGLPSTFILDAEGQVIYQAMGERAWDSDAILGKVRALKPNGQSSHNDSDNSPLADTPESAKGLLNAES
ncbi:MAG: TlpA family protein disulfide reductase [Leucothrix sp.]